MTDKIAPNYADSIATLKVLTEDVQVALTEMYLICAEEEFSRFLTASFIAVTADDEIMI